MNFFFLLLLISAFNIDLASANAQSEKNADNSTDNEPGSIFTHSSVPESITVPPSNISNFQTIAEIQVRYVDRENQPTTSKTRSDIITREFKLQPGDIYDAELAQQGLEGVKDLVIVERASLSLEPTDRSDRVVMVVTVTESSPFLFAFGGTLQPPTALYQFSKY